MIIIEGQARFRDARDIVRLRPEIETIIRRSREEAGCLDFTAAIDVLDPCMVTIVGKWDSWDSFQIHYNSDYNRHWHETVIATALHGHVVQVYDVTGSRKITGEIFANDP